MAEVKISKRYAKGFFDLVKESNHLSDSYAEIKEISEVIKENVELQTALSSPILDDKQKNSMLKAVFKNLSASTFNFLTLITKQGRANLIQDIAQQFILLYNQKIDRNTANIIIAEDLPENILNQILAVGKKQLAFEGKEIEINKKIDPSIIGGFVFQIKDKQIDASVRNRLNDLKSKFDTKLYESHI